MVYALGMIAIYIRVSSHSQTAASQRIDIQRWLDAHGYGMDQMHWFEDHETGRLLKRPAFEQLQQAIFSGEVKTVLAQPRHLTPIQNYVRGRCLLSRLT